MARERVAAPMRNAMMEKLTQKVVVIHGMVDEEGNYGGSPELVFRQKFTLEDAIESHACSLETNMGVTNGIPLDVHSSYCFTL
jgi:hypothetical protein